MAGFIRTILHVPGIHWISTRVGGKALRSLSFDEKFRSGDWSFDGECPDLVRIVETLRAGGNVLLMGCGTAPIATILAPASFATILGVDLSKEAILRARARVPECDSARIRFELGDMLDYQPNQPFDVVLFSESIYYAPRPARQTLLERIRENLTSRGKIIVTIAQPDRYAGILKMIRERFCVELDRPLEGGKRHVLVFS